MSAENIKQLTIAGSGGGGQKAPSEDSDSLQSRSYVGIVDLLGEGQIGGLVDKDKSLYLNGTPLRSEADEFNFEDVSWDERKGTQNQDYITGFGDIETPFPVGTQLKYNVPSSFIVTNPRVDEVRIILGISALVKTDDDGDVHGSSVKFEFSMAMNGRRYEVVDTRSVIGKASSRYQRSYNLKLPKKLTDGTPVTRWSFQVKRLTADSTSQVESNETFIDSYAEIVSKKLTYPNSALIATRFNAEHFSSMPKREYLVDGLLVRVPSNYNPETRIYSGVWDGTFKLASSSNPAWIMYDLLLSTRYGLGEYIDVNMVDEARLYQVGQYCDQMVDDGFGKKEPRYSINCVINTRAEAYDLIMDISSVFNGMAYWAGDQVGFMIDAPSDPIMAFTPANIVGEFGYTGTSIKDRHSIAAVTWNDPEDDYKQAIEYVEDPDLVELYGVRKIDMQAFGCTSRGQAHRQGRWMLYTEHQQSETIVFTAGMDATTLMPGDIIQIQDPDRSGKRFGGRLVSCSARSATLDDAVDFGEFTGLKIAMLLEDGSFIERPIKTKTQANVRIGSTSTVRKLTTVTWEEALTKMPVAQGVWVISAPQLELVQARVVNVKQGEDISTAEITAVPHNPNKYLSIENGIMLEVPVTSSLNSRQQDAPTEVRIKQEVVTSQGIAKTRLVIDWDSAKNASQYDVQWKRDDGNWVQMPPTANLSVEVEDVYQGIYKARVAAKSIFGAKSYYTYSVSADLKGKQGKPANVVGLTANGVLFGMELSWIYSAGKDNISHVVIEHSFSDGHLDAKLLGNFAYPTTGHTITGLAGNQKIGYRIKVADKSGNESDWSEWASGTTSANPSAMLDILNGHIGESSLDAILTGKIDTIDSSVKQNIKDVQTNADAIVKEAKDRATSVAAEATARAAALTKEVTNRTAAISTATTKEATDRAAALVKEATDRAAALAKEVTDRNAAIGTATAKEASDRAAALLKEVTDRTSAITAAATKEATDRANAITAATTKEATDRANAIAAEATSRANAIAAATTKEATDRANAIAAETTARANAITTATTKEATDRANAIAAEAKARGDALTAEVTARNSAITAEATARAAAITAAVKVETTARTTAITKEVTDRNAAIAVETAARGNAITAEVTARNKAITDKATEINASVKTQVDALQAGITKEVTDRTAGDTAVRGELNAYKTANNTAVAAVLEKAEAAISNDAATASKVTGLQSSLDTTNANVAKKADATALNSYYTKTEADTATAGKIDAYKASLVIGGVNQLLNSEGERSSTAASRREYLMYENSAHICQFYDDNLEKEVTISFDLKVAVAGSVQVYCSNGTHHTFSAGVSVSAANVDKWVRYSVTVRPVKHATNTTVTRSAVEFYGTYDSGRIPVVRKVQLEAGNVATAWSPSPRDTQATLDANATAINTTNTEVSRVNGVVTAQGTSITKLQSDLAATDAKAGTGVTNAATAQQTANTAVTATEANAARITSLDSSFNSYKTANDQAIVQTNANVSTVEKTSTDADKALGIRIDTVVATAKTDKTSVTALVTAETTARTSADTALTGRIDALSASTTTELGKNNAAVTAEQTARTTADTALGKRIDSVVATATSDKSTLQSAITSEQAARTSADTALGQRIDTVTANATTDKSTLQTAITTEQTARTTADTALGQRIDTLTTTVSNNDTAVKGQIKTVEDSVTTLTGSTNTKITALESSLATTNTNVGKKADATTVNAIGNRVTTAEGKITSQGESITSLTNSLATTDANVAKKADAAALSSLNTKVETINGQVTTQGTSITTLNANLATTNTNVATAQSAANAANTLAGGKGKVIVQAAAPATADRLAQNLWIDITGGANTPKRWLTNAWVAVTDKVATDAAAAAANALSVANTKADAAAFNTLDTKVTAIEGNVTSQGTSITKLTNDLVTTNTNVAKKADTTALTALDTKVTAVDGKVTTNASAITTLQGRATTIEGNVAKKAEATALNSYYTKTAADTAIAGQINDYKATLKIGGRNLWDTSKTISAHESLGNPSSNSNGAHRFLPTYIETSGDKLLFQLWNQNKIINTSNTNRVAFYTEDKVYISSTALNLLNGSVYQKQEISIPSNAKFMRLAVISGSSSYDTSIKIKFELGTVFTDWTASEEEVASSLEANATAINTTNAEVSRVNGVVTAQGTSISKLQSDLATTDTKAGTAVVNAATAQQTANTAVTATESNASRITSLDSSFSSYKTANDAALVKTNANVSSVEKTSSDADKALGVRIDTVVATAKTDKTATTALVTAETTARTTADTALSTRIDTLSASTTTELGKTNSAVTTEQQARTSADTALGGRIDAVIATAKTDKTAVTALVTAETTARTTADTALTSRIDTLTTTVASNNTKATGSIADIAKSVTTLEGSTNTKISTLQSSLDATNSNVAKKADATALNDYYTKTAADTATAGKIDEYKAALSIGGVNQLKNSEAERTSQAASNKEYLMYELSPQIKAFYNDNLNKDITISFDLKVAVAGAVQVYCSNGTFHTFNVGINVAAADVDTWVRYKVTTQPRLHPTNTAYLNSGLEFYGVYGTGRIPYLRKVQLEAGNVATDWSPSPRDTQAALTANANAIQTTNTEVSRINGITVSNTSAITSLTGRIATAENGLATKADASAVSALTTRMTAAEGVNTSQGTSITKLTNDLAATNTELTTKASSAALSALDSKVTTQAGITTSQGSSITKLTNALALTDAAVAKKAEATALSALDTKVTGQGNTLTSQGTAITKLTTDLSTLDTKVNTKANSTVVSSLDSKVTSIEGTVTSQGTSLTSLTNRVELAEGNINKKADSSAVTSLDSKVTKQGLDITSQGAAITRIDAAIDATNLAVATKASAAALSTLDSKVTSIDGKVSSNTSAITSLTGRVTATEGALTTKASVDAVNSLTTRVTSAEGSIASQATSITSLNSGLVTTNTNVTAAQTAANNANTLAGGKGKVFFQNAAPAVADRLAQNLWIDTTGNNNTPKRWLTNAWVAVNDKIATDALTAANAANVAVATKADATALSSLDSKVTTINGTVTSQGASITNLNTRLSSAEEALTTKANSSAVSALDSKVTQQGNTITSQGTDITKLKADLALTNTAVSTKASSEALQSLDNRVVSIDGKVTTNASAITSLNGKMTTAEKGLATKLDASVISEYYTKTQADTATTGKIDEFNAALVIGGVNLVAGSNDISQANNGSAHIVAYTKGSPNRIKNISNNGGISTYTPYFVDSEVDAVYTTSVRVKPDAATKLGLYNITDASRTALSSPMFDCPANVWTTLWCTFKSKVTSVRLSGFRVQLNGGFTDNVTVEYKEYQMEYGTKVTAWAEAPSEIKAQIADVVTANANAIQNTNSEVSRVNGVVVSQGTALTKLTGDLATTNGTLATKADGSALTALTNRVTSAEGVNTTQSSNITTLTNNLATTNTNVATKANTSAVTALDSKVTGIDGRVTANTSNITSLSGRVTTTENGLATKADTSAVTALTTRVGTVEGGLSTASSNVTKLQNDLVVTNNVANAALPRIAGSGAYKIFNNVFTHQASVINDTRNIVIETPIAFINIMFKLIVSGYNYRQANSDINLTVGGYAYSASGTILNNSASNTGNMPIRIRIGVKNSKVCLILTSLTADRYWSYPKLNIDAEMGQVAIPDSYKDGWSAVMTAEADLTTSGVTWIAEPPNLDVGTSLAANATAITATNSEVTRINGVVVSQGSSITTLQGNISTINGTLATKADGSAVTALTTRVTNAEGVNTTQSGQITTLTNNLSTTDGKVANKAESSAVSNLDSKVTAVDGRVTTNSSLITSLSGRVTTTENNIATKAEASALNKYYTKEQSDTAIAGKISEFSSKLDIGGVNQLLNSAAARTAAPREYMVYERSEELKAFFDELMRTGQDFVVSGEISVPVAGSVQVYSGNGSFHSFSGGVNVTEVNKFVRFVVTYPNAYLREQGANANKHATQSTLEFYGTYDSGRFPTVRNVQLEAGTKATSWSPSPRDTQAALTANATAISTTNAEVSRVNGVVVSQGTQLTNLNATLTTLSGTVNTKADAAALTSLTTRVTNAEGVNSTQSGQITTLTGNITTINGSLATKAENSALTALDSKVTAIDGRVTSQNSSITTLNSSLATTNTNVTAAQNAANAANTLAGGKGKVLYQTATPTGADQDAKNLWIDIAANANTPKRWNGTAWVAVSDKAATDALAAANAANTALTTKADASAVTALTTRVTNAEGVNTSQGSAITSLENSVNNVATGLNSKASTSALNALDSKVTSVDGKVTTNASSITTLQGKMTTVENGLATKADASAVTSLTTRVTNAEGVNTSQATALTNLNTAVNGHTTSISNTTTTVNGIKAVKTVTVNNNGVLSGYGLMSELVNGQVTSAFGINADQFYIGSPSSNKKLFIVTTGNKTIDGVTYPAGTWIDTANIANATIQTAHIKDLSVSTAKIDNGAITTAKIGSLQVDSVHIKNRAVTVPLGIKQQLTGVGGTATAYSNWQKVVRVRVYGLELIESGNYCTLFYAVDLRMETTVGKVIYVDVMVGNVNLARISGSSQNHYTDTGYWQPSGAEGGGPDTWIPSGNLVLTGTSSSVSTIGTKMTSFIMPAGITANNNYVDFKFNVLTTAGVSITTTGTSAEILFMEFKK